MILKLGLRRTSSMEQQVLLWVLSGLCGAVILLLGAIWSEMRKLNDRFHELAILQAEQNSRISTVEKVVDRLPCLLNLTCPNGR